MRKAFKASRLMGLLALTAGFMAFGATAAQAEPGAFWLIAGQNNAGPLLPAIQAEKDGTHFLLLTKVGLANVEILCTEIKFVNAKLHELGRATGKIHFSGGPNCITKVNGAQQNACTPKSPGAPLGLIETNPLEGLIKLHLLTTPTHKLDELVELKPSEAGKPFVTLEMGATCAIGNKIDITGTYYIKDCTNEGLVDKVKHLVEEGPLSALLFGGNAAKIHGSAWTFLDGAHAGLTFAGHPA